MQILGIIIVTFIIGIWYGMFDISFGITSTVRSGAIRFKSTMGLLLASICLGYLFIYSNYQESEYTTYWNIPYPLVAFIIVISASIALIILKKASPINSLCYTLLGSIWGWQFYNDTLNTNSVIYTTLFAVFTPIIAGAFSLLIFTALRRFIRQNKFHLLHQTIFMREAIAIAIILVGIGLSINNIPVFLALLFPLSFVSEIEVTSFAISSQMISALVIIIVLVGASYFPARKRMQYWGKRGLTMNLEPTLAILLSVALVFLLFSNPWIYKLLNSKLIPISPIPLIIGAMFGISLVRKNKSLDFKLLIQAGATLFITPLVAFVICYSIFAYLIVPDLIDTFEPQFNVGSQMISLKTPLIILFVILTIVLVALSFQRQKTQRQKAQEALKFEQHERYLTQQNLTGMELKAIQLENQKMNQKIDVRRQELINIALNVNEQRLFFEELEGELKKIEKIKEIDKVYEEIKRIRSTIDSRKNFSNEMSGFYSEVEVLHKNFLSNLMERFPDLTEQEKRLATLLRLGFSTKEIAGLVNITPKSVEVNRYRLRKSLNMKRGENLVQFIKHI